MVIFFFNDTATTEIYTLSLHDALPILPDSRGAVARDGADGLERSRAVSRLVLGPVRREGAVFRGRRCRVRRRRVHLAARPDRKSTRLNSSHANISYAAFCLKKKNHQSL